MQIKQLKTEEECKEWDLFVAQTANSTFFHKSGWKQVIEQSLGHQTYYTYVEEEGEIVAILPLAHVKSIYFGNALISTPLCVYGGILSISDSALNKLQEFACDLAKKLNVDYLEFRNRNEVQIDWPKKDLYVTFRKKLVEDVDENLKQIPRKQRAMIRKGEKFGLQLVENDTVNEFFKAYSESVRNLGTPVLSRAVYKKIHEVFLGDCALHSVELENETIASVMSFYFKDEVLPYYGGGIYKSRSLKANDFMYWELLKLSVARGVRVFDFGRSKVDTGSFSFKKHWGFIPEPMCYQYYLVKSQSLPNISPTNPKYQLFIKLWKKLPLSIANYFGPFLAKYLV